MCCFGGSFMKGEPENMKMLSGEERRGLLTSQSHGSYGELTTSGGGI